MKKLFMYFLLCIQVMQAIAQSTIDYEPVYYIDGLDTIDFIYVDTLASGDGFRRSPSSVSSSYNTPDEALRGIGTTGGITINLGFKTKPINEGIFGYHIGGIFDQNTLYNDSASAEQWQWMSDLSPASLRFPAGANSKFMHLLHNTDGSDAVGYGYDFAEVTKYFDNTDGTMHNPTLVDVQGLFYEYLFLKHCFI